MGFAIYYYIYLLCFVICYYVESSLDQNEAELCACKSCITIVLQYHHYCYDLAAIRRRRERCGVISTLQIVIQCTPGVHINYTKI